MMNNIAAEETKKKKNKPQELPSNRPVARLNPSSISGIVVKKTGFDPRFEGATTEDDKKLFRSAYKFIDDIQQDEVQVCLATIRLSS